MESQMGNGAVSGAGTAAAPSQRGAQWAARVRAEVQQAVVGQDAVIERALVALLADGHVLIEGMPGLAKTLLVKSLAHGARPRVRARPVHPRPAALRRRRHHGLPAAARRVPHPPAGRSSPTWCSPTRSTARPAKVQSALLEAMQERQVTIGGHSHPLPRPFLVMATQNPVEQEGTYPLPEAQTDRFLFKLLVDYPAEHEEYGMLGRWSQVTRQPSVRAVSSPAELLALRAEVDEVYVSEDLQRYVLALVRATRDLAHGRGSAMNGGPPPLAFGASPRATLALVQAARALAYVRGQDYATAAMVQALFGDAVRHRVGLTYEAEAEQVTPDAVLQRVLATTPIPPRT